MAKGWWISPRPCGKGVSETEIPRTLGHCLGLASLGETTNIDRLDERHDGGARASGLGGPAGLTRKRRSNEYVQLAQPQQVTELAAVNYPDAG